MPDEGVEALEDPLAAGDPEAAEQLALRALEGARQQADAGPRAEAALQLACARWARGDAGAARGPADEALQAADEAGLSLQARAARGIRAASDAYLGRYDDARAAAERLVGEAEQHGETVTAARALCALAEVALRGGDVERATARLEDAARRVGPVAHPTAQRLAVEANLALAEALLDRDGPSDGSVAAARLADARSRIEQQGLQDQRLPLRMLLARAMAATGDDEAAVGELESVIEAARGAKRHDVEWRARRAAAKLYGLRGAEFAVRRHELAATEVLESIATALPVKLRDAFWNDPRRAEVRRRASGASDRHPVAAPSPDVTFHRPGIESRTQRLLEILKRLASEHDVDRLLERITDSAVELSGAERGFVLLLDDDGKLEPRLVRDAGTQAGDPSVAFSQSIAEAVLIDGEPIVTVDARDDQRLSEYLSVHKLMLKSVACLPIRGHSGTLGVLYLEHRMRRGRFREEELDLLLAFADQAAIALENARLLAENERRHRELESANAELERAKGEIERVLVARTAELEQTRQELDRTRDELRGSFERHGIVGRSEAMRRVYAVIDRVRETDVAIVIQGESGTGKELVARATHYGGPRSKKPFVAINCAAIPEALLESELFGHVRGAFTGADRDRRGVLAQASGGTLFLDEVGDMPAKMQVDLLRVLQDGKVCPVGGNSDETVDVRIIAASNKSLQQLVEQGQFREDLYYRLNVVELRLPSLRERVEDIPLLSDHFLAKIAKREKMAPKRLSREAIERIAASPMPGNVRQLEHLLLNACVMVEGDVIGPDDLALGEDSAANDRLAAERAQPATRAARGAEESPPAQSLDDYKAAEKQRILEALERSGWNRARAASELGIPRRTFYRRLREHGIL